MVDNIAWSTTDRNICILLNRKRLFSLMNDLPTVFEVITERVPLKDKHGVDSGSKSRSSTKVKWSEFFYICSVLLSCVNLVFIINTSTQRASDGHAKGNPRLQDGIYVEEDEDEHGETLCGSCGGNYNADEFWICCDICERWFHGKCVKITPAKAEHIKQYKCPSCSTKKGRP